MKFGHKKLETLHYHTVKTWHLSDLALIQYRGMTPGQMDGQTELR